MRIGIFGGTFNPIHHCHLRIARETRKRMRLNRVFFVPSGRPPHKPKAKIISSRDRLKMVRLAIAGEPHFSLSDQEINRSGKSYAVETIGIFRKKYPDSSFFFILGIDAFLEIRNWKQAKRLLSLCHFVVVSRYGYYFQQLAKLSHSIQFDRSSLLALDRGKIKRKEIFLKSGYSLFLLKLPPCRASSTKIRDRLSARQDMINFLPEAVKSYILKRGLYCPLSLT